MEIKFVGGPFGGTKKDVPTLDNGKPIPVYKYFQLQPTKIISHDLPSKDSDRDVSYYILKEIWLGGRLSHYEYHHEGR